MEQLIETMKVVLGTSTALYIKAQNYHWNVTGPNFAEYHNFFGSFYEEVYSSVDTTAEEIRKLGAFTPGSLERFLELSIIEEEKSIPTPDVMFARLANSNDAMLRVLYEACDSAEEIGARGTVNYLEERIGIHEKHAWMLKSF